MHNRDGMDKCDRDCVIQLQNLFNVCSKTGVLDKCGVYLQTLKFELNLLTVLACAKNPNIFKHGRE